ncbi:flagellar biosynthetic protein FliR [Mitsuaria sp. GD03876]|uniref:flagellar biosynthetic protein FliR n=1 Tax=Mitsuaria sp. GD03876 TaxID=2975399 RepID=UPI0024495CF0|nr:flagellar biosynthetic protein FliR [Mitsuaria sp. GD03876]MDH0868254.1 flagellar biosynthetic protein FliR [Mitsuaria sp. GD03876]
MELEIGQLTAWLSALWWPFCRAIAMLAAAPTIGDAGVPVSARALLALVLAVVLMPVSQSTAVAIPIFSMHGLLAAGEQAILGLAMGLTFHLAMAVIGVLGFLLSSQLGLAMAVLNDPINGSASDVVGALLNVLCVLAFFGMDGHLLFIAVLGESFRAWPVGAGLSLLTLQNLAYNLGWAFSAALLLALPVVAATLVVQLGMGFLNRVAPALNLFSLGYALVTLFGLFMLTRMLAHVPAHYLRMTQQLLRMLEQGMRGVPGGGLDG